MTASTKGEERNSPRNFKITLKNFFNTFKILIS